MHTELFSDIARSSGIKVSINLKSVISFESLSPLERLNPRGEKEIDVFLFPRGPHDAHVDRVSVSCFLLRRSTAHLLPLRAHILYYQTCQLPGPMSSAFFRHLFRPTLTSFQRAFPSPPESLGHAVLL
jgi:hypothetical protein